MSNLYQEYQDRVHYKGKTKREYVKTKVSESIENLIQDSQYGFTITIGEQEHEVAILSTKTTQDYESANVIAPLSVGMEKGVVFGWNDNKWILLQKMFRPDQPGFNGIAYRCTGELKWIDEEDNTLHVQPAYIRSGRITSALGVTPDVNRKFDNIILHDTDWNMMAATPRNFDIHQEMRFILNGQAYRVTNVDNVSIDNVSIVSLVDDKLLDTDDTVNMIAYKDDYIYTLKSDLKDDTKMFVDDIMELPIKVLKDGIVVDEDYILESLTPDIIEVSGNKIIGRGLGNGIIRCYLTRNNTIYIDIPVTIDETHHEIIPELFIEGDDYIEWNNSQTYMLSDKSDAYFEVEVKSKIRKKITFTNNSVTIAIEDKYSGTIDITCETEQGVVTKTVYIRTI